MTTRKQKQVAYNERISAAEEDAAGYNCDIADFLSDHSAVETTTIAINAADSLKQGEAVLGGQYWQQQSHHMAAVNGIPDGMPNTRASAILSAAVEAVVWKHPIETTTPEGKRCSARIVFFPADMPPIAEELQAFKAGRSELEEGKHVAYAVFAKKMTIWSGTTLFYPKLFRRC
jgi:hypothetical protein